MPDALKIRLLLPGASELDDKSLPKMGFADLDMVRETFAKIQLPAVQGDGPDRHLAVARRVVRNDQAAGVILASLNYDFVAKSVQAAEIKAGYIELKQAALVLGAAGENPMRSRAIMGIYRLPIQAGSFITPLRKAQVPVNSSALSAWSCSCFTGAAGFFYWDRRLSGC